MFVVSVGGFLARAEKVPALLNSVWNFLPVLLSNRLVSQKEVNVRNSRSATTAVPNINVTPLIDVLLVMLIIFMVAAPLRHHKFTTKLPAPPDDRVLPPNVLSLVVTVGLDRSLRLNGLTDMGTVDDPSKLNQRLVSLFAERKKNHVYSDAMATRSDLPEEQRIERTVFIKAPRTLPYGAIAQVIDELKGSGAEPIGLQLDGLN